MSVTKNYYLLSQSRVQEEEVEKIEMIVKDLSKELYRRINKEAIQLWTLAEVHNLFQIEYEEKDWFIGDEDYFFYEEEDGTIAVNVFGKDELVEGTICPSCQFSLYKKLLPILIDKLKCSQNTHQLELPLIAIQEGLQCPNCGVIIETNNLTERKLLGNFRIKLPLLLFEKMYWNEIIGYFYREDEEKFFIDYYQFV